LALPLTKSNEVKRDAVVGYFMVLFILKGCRRRGMGGDYSFKIVIG